MSRSLRRSILSIAVLLSLAGQEGMPQGRLDSSKYTHPLLVAAASSYQLRDFGAAIHQCSDAIRALKLRRDHVQLAAAYSLLGGAYIRTGEFEKALSALREGLQIAMLLPQSEQLVLGDLYYQLGVYYDRLGHGEESLDYHQKSLDLRLRTLGEMHPAVAESYLGLGELYLYTLLDFRKANTWFGHALRIIEPSSAQDDLSLYFVHFYLAQANRRLGDLDNALTHAFKALSVIRSHREYDSYLERCYTLLGDIFYSKTDYVHAIENYQAGISESIRRDGSVNYNLIRKYTNLGVAYGESDHPSLAVACFRRSIAISAMHHHTARLKAENFLHLGRTYQKTGDTDSAYYYLTEYLRSQRAEYGDKHTLTGQAHRYLARYFQHVGAYDSAAACIQKALVASVEEFDASDATENPPYGMIGDQYALFQVLGDKGSILLERYSSEGAHTADLISAFECFGMADSLMQLSRNSYEQEGSRLFFADHYHGVYENALHACYLLYEKTGDNRYIEDAFAFMEKSKAFLLAEALSKAEIFSRAGLPDSLREMERGLNSAIASYRSKLEGADHHGQGIDEQQQIQAKLFEMTQKQERLLETIARTYPSYFQIKYQKIASVDEIQFYARNNSAAVVEYFWGTDRIFVLAVTADRLLFREVSNSDSIASQVRQYFHALQQPAWKENDPTFDAFVSSARALYSELLEPVMHAVRSENVIIIRDGPLLLVPFESMLVSGNHFPSRQFADLDYLIRHKTVSYAHSADLLLKNASRLRRSTDEKKVLAFSYSPLDVNAVPPTTTVLNELPGAAKEIAAIEDILPGAFLTGDQATETKFKSMAAGYDILHLAVHGRSDPDRQFSGTLYFRQAPGEPDDGQLHVYELYELALKARLAVLSACESGVGKIFRGEGVFSIARGFAYAGCPSAVMTLWPVSDLASAQIMGDFYDALHEGERIDFALRKAKLNYLEQADPQLAHPAYWAAYVPSGNMDPVIYPAFPFNFLLVAVAVLTGVAAFGIFLRRRSRHRAPQNSLPV